MTGAMTGFLVAVGAHLGGLLCADDPIAEPPSLRARPSRGGSGGGCRQLYRR